MRKRYPGNFKVKVAWTAIKSEITIAELSSKFEVHTTHIMRWKKEVLTALPDLVNKDKSKLSRNLRNPWMNYINKSVNYKLKMTGHKKS